jgi:ppGpp synthetase/RelA/SpoT-type nucleotidyltranferase
MADIDYQELSELHLALADDFLCAAKQLKSAIVQLVSDSFPEDPPLIDFKARQKELESVAQKAVVRGWDVEQVRSQMADLTGVRLICLHLSQIEELRFLLRELENRSVIHIKKEDEWIETPQESGYRGVHLDVDIKLSKHKKEGVRVTDIPCEIQIRTLVQHAWSERAHGLIHKPDYQPSDRIRKLFSIESLRLHGHQKTMDALWEMALWERKLQETDESINPLSIKSLADEFGEALTDQMAMDLYRNIRSIAPLEKIDDLRGILSNAEIQNAITGIYRAQLRRVPDLTGRLVFGSLMRSSPDEGRSLSELNIIASPEFRSKDILPFDFNVIGRADHSFTRHRDRGGGWFAYHTVDCVGVIRGRTGEDGKPDGVEISAQGERPIFRTAYPLFSLAYPGEAVKAAFILDGSSHVFILATTTKGQQIFFEYGREYEKVSQATDDRDGTVYVRSPVETSGEDSTVLSNLPDLLEAAALDQQIHLIHGFYCEANPRLVLRMVEVHKNRLSGP